MLESGKFTINDSESFDGFHNPACHWNGFAVPVFTQGEAVKIARWVNAANGEETLKIDITKQTATFNEGGEVYTIDAEMIETRHGKRRVYGIGAGWWVWMVCND